jgi:hypothetical protein
VLRHRYQFSRPLSAAEVELLTLLISWRKGSSITTSGAAVIGCCAHPDDVCDFEKRMRRQGAELQAMRVLS